MQKTFFISDLHAYHKNIIRYDNRPFFTVSEMNNALISNWNNVVTSKDIVYILGDVSWGNEKETEQFLQQLNGHKRLIIGNHDKIIVNSSVLRGYFDSIDHYAKIKVSTNGGVTKAVLSHFFIPFYDGHYNDNTVMLYGHSHNTNEHNQEVKMVMDLNGLGFKNQSIIVGCMHRYMKYTPRTLDELLIPSVKQYNGWAVLRYN